MKTNSKWLKTGIAVFLAIQMVMFSFAMTLAEDPATVETSNVLAVSQLAVWAQEVEDPGEEEVPEGATRVSIVWLPDDATFEEDSITAVIAGSGIPEMVKLERANGWKATVALTPSAVPFSCALVGLKGYTVEQSASNITFTVTLDVAPVEEPEDEITDDPSSILGDDDDDTEDIGLDVADIPAAADLNVEIEVSYIMADESLYYGDTALFTGHLHGYDGFDYRLDWQVDKGNGWEYIENANTLTYEVVLTPENIDYLYRLEATILIPDELIDAYNETAVDESGE